jgi:hypothetical protein
VLRRLLHDQQVADPIEDHRPAFAGFLQSLDHQQLLGVEAR